MKKNIFLLGIASLYLTACVQVNPPRDVSSEEKAGVYLKMGVRYMEMGNLHIAKENLEKALNEDSDDANIHNALAVLYERIERIPDAQEHYLRAISLDEENAQSKNNYGRFLCQKGDYTEGLKHLNIALKMPLNNRKWIALTNAGLCQIKSKDKQQAEKNFRLALKLHQNYAPALLEMQKISYHQRKYMSARAFLQRYLNVARKTPETLWYAYQTERSLNDPKTAADYRHDLLKNFPNSEEAKKVR